MRKFVLLAVLVITLPAMCQAQPRIQTRTESIPRDRTATSRPAKSESSPKLEIFGGYSYLRADDVSSGSNMHGWNSSVTANTNNWFGVTLDFSGNYRGIEDRPATTARVNTHLMTVGPQLAFRRSESLTPFVHILAGVGRSGYRSSTPSGYFSGVHYSYAMVAGGGLDIKLSDGLAYRLFQGDYVLTRFGGRLEHHVRVSTGFVMRAGKNK